MEKTTNNELRLRILPIMLYCQANKGDLNLFESWKDKEDAGKKMFYIYYSGLFCRILSLLETTSIPRHFVRDCNSLLDKYNWYDIHEKDLELCKSAGPCGWEVPDALEFIESIDDIVWKDSSLNHERDAFVGKRNIQVGLLQM